MRWRTLTAGFGILLVLALYTILIINISDFLPDVLLFQTVYYIIAGLAWIPAVLVLMGWAQKDQT
jgi:hypothetical protein